MRTLSTGFDFTVLGRGSVPWPDIISIPIKLASKVDTTSLYNICLNILTFIMLLTPALLQFLILIVAQIRAAQMDFGTTLVETLNQEETSLNPGHFSHFWEILKSFPRGIDGPKK